MKKSLLTSLVLLLSLFMIEAYAQTISGTVTDENGESLPGVTILVKGTTDGAATDVNGNFSINASDGDVLVFSGIGMQTQEITVGSQTSISVEMVTGTTELNKVVVVGYGEADRRELTGSVSSISGKSLENFNVSNFEQVLQGRAAGVQVSQTAGTLGSPITVRVRGVSSINASSQPLYVIDGIPITSGAQGTNLGSAANTGGGQNALQNINPNDIESIEILKDASATAVYGARAANGVILITTKKGKAGKPRVNINYYAGFTDHTELPDYLNGEQFTQLWNSGLQNAAAGGFTSQAAADLFSLPTDSIISTDWIDEVTRRGFIQELSASVSGGNDRTTYYIGGTYQDTEGYIIGNELQKYSIRANITQEISDKVKVELLLNPSYSVLARVSESNQVQAPLTLGGLQYPNIPAFTDDGDFAFDAGPNPFGLAFNSNPIADVREAEFTSRITQVIGNLNLQYEPIKGLLIRTELGADIFQQEEFNKDGARTTNGQPTGDGSQRNVQILNWNINNIISYTRTFNSDHNFKVTFANQVQNSTERDFSVNAGRFPSDQFRTVTTGAQITGGTGTETEFSFVGLLGRLNYNYKGKYIAEFIIRGDASSRFGENNRWGVFPAGSVGWVISEEDFLSGADFIDLLKLRGSIGVQGNAGIGNFASLSLFQAGPTTLGNANYNDFGGVFLRQIGDPDLKWETTTQVDAAIDYGFLNNRIRGTIGYFYKETDDLLLAQPVSSTNGVATVLRNVGSMSNQGIEFDIAADIFDGDFKWTTSFNIATIRNEVLSLQDNDGDGQDDDIIIGENIARVGEPLGSFFLVPYAGVDPTNGDALFTNLDGENTPAYSTADRRIEGDPFPDFYGGFTNTFSFKGIDLTVFFQYSVGQDMYVSDGEFNRTGLTSIFNNLTTELDAWTPENPNTDVPQLRSILGPTNGSQVSSRYLQDASFLRLKQLSIGYTFPESLLKNVRLRVFAQGQNLWTLTDEDFTGYDPENNFANNDALRQGNVFFGTPQQVTVTFGANLSF